MNSAAFHSRRRRIAHALANHSNLSLRVDVDVDVILALIHARVGRSRSFAFAFAVSMPNVPFVPKGGSIDRRSRSDAFEFDVETNAESTRTERNGTEPNRTRISDPRRRCLPFARAIIHPSFAHFRIHSFRSSTRTAGRGTTTQPKIRIRSTCRVLHTTRRVVIGACVSLARRADAAIGASSCGLIDGS
jgi:hypothetical protein